MGNHSEGVKCGCPYAQTGILKRSLLLWVENGRKGRVPWVRGMVAWIKEVVKTSGWM